MSQFKFSCDHKISEEHPGGDYTQVVFDADNIDCVIERFEEFLRGCGYYFQGQIVRYESDPEPVAQQVQSAVVTQPLATSYTNIGVDLADPQWEGQDY